MDRGSRRLVAELDRIAPRKLLKTSTGTRRMNFGL